MPNFPRKLSIAFRSQKGRRIVNPPWGFLSRGVALEKIERIAELLQPDYRSGLNEGLCDYLVEFAFEPHPPTPIKNAGYPVILIMRSPSGIPFKLYLTGKRLRSDTEMWNWSKDLSRVFNALSAPAQRTRSGVIEVIVTLPVV